VSAKAAFLLLLAIAAVLPPQRPPDHEARGALAILRRDGVILPFASFNRDDWRVSWPVALSNLDLPIGLGDIPEKWWGTPTPAQWRGHLTNGELIDIELRAPVTFRTWYCRTRLGLSTSYQSSLPLPPTPVEPFPKDGLAVSSHVPVERIESVDRASADWAALPLALLPDVDRLEDSTVAGVRINSGWRHPFTKEERHRQPIRLESWYRSPSGEPGWTVSYIEAVRAYPLRTEDKGCGLETFISGWLHHQNGVLKRPEDLRMKLTYCDRVGAMYMLPMGRIRPRDRWYWIFQMSGWDSEWYDVVEVRREKIRYVIEVFAGGRFSGCRS
jgi:hypothetical protein